MFPGTPTEGALYCRRGYFWKAAVGSGKDHFCTMSLAGMLIVPTFQRSMLDLVRMGDNIEAEKDRLLELVSMTFPFLDAAGQVSF